MILRLPLDEFVANPWQTRLAEPDEEYIAGLAVDIARNGLLQTPVGRERQTADGRWHIELAFGHNRLAAYVHLAADAPETWGTMPVDVLELSDEQMADFAWSENNQRRDLSPIERAHAVQKRIEDFEWDQAQAAEHLGLSRPAVSNILRLLKLPEEIQLQAAERGLSERQALALVSLYDLPESIRQDARSHWELAPEKIIELAMDGASSDAIRRQVNRLVDSYAQRLEQAPFTLDQELAGEGINSAACRECEYRHKERNLCIDRMCYRRKVKAYELAYLVNASRACGVPEIEADIDSQYITRWDSEWMGGKDLEQIKLAGCENLRLVYASEPTKSKLLAPEGFPNARYACKMRSGYCRCVNGLKMARELEERRESTPTPALPLKGEGEGEREGDESAREILLPSEPSDYDIIEETNIAAPQDGKTRVMTAKELEELARQKRQEKREAQQAAQHIENEMAESIYQGLRENQIGAWRLALSAMTWEFHLTETDKLSLDDLLLKVARYAAEKSMPYVFESGPQVAREVNKKLEEVGLYLVHEERELGEAS